MDGLLEILLLNIPESLLIISFTSVFLCNSVRRKTIVCSGVFMAIITYIIQQEIASDLFSQILIFSIYIFTIKILNENGSILKMIAFLSLSLFIFMLIELFLSLFCMYILNMTIIEMQSSLYIWIIISIPIRIVELIFVIFISQELDNLKQSIKYKFRRN